MMAGDEKGNGKDSGVKRSLVAEVTVALDLSTFTLTIGGSAPTNEFAKAMLQMAVDEAERMIQRKRMEQAITLAPSSMLDAFKRR